MNARPKPKTPRRHRILIATDGSPPAQAALTTASLFPWPEGTQARAVVAYADWLRPENEQARAALARNYEATADLARRELRRRWNKADAIVRDEAPIDAILGQADAFRASIIALGWRGHGTFRRLLAGSVSRGVAAHAQCPVLVVRDAPRAVRRFVVGYDSSAYARRALDFLCSLKPPRGGRVVLVNVVQPMATPRSASLIPASARAAIRHEVKALNAERLDAARRLVDAGVARLRLRGWSATGEVRSGAPLERLMTAVADHSADLLIVGARAVTGVERMLLGSVANGALNRSAVPVLLAR